MNARALSFLTVGLACAAGASSAVNGQESLRVSENRVGLMASGQDNPRQPTVRRVIIRNQLVLKIPLQPRQSNASQYRLLETPRCVATREITGANMSGQRTIDFTLANDRRLRVHMSKECKSLDFYGGFYLQPQDERVCVQRDVIRTRMGGNCQIERFQLLQPITASSASDR